MTRLATTSTTSVVLRVLIAALSLVTHPSSVVCFHPTSSHPTSSSSSSLGRPHHGRWTRPLFLSQTVVPPTSTTSILNPPSWEELSASLDELDSNSGKENEEPQLTLYRDTNGWCPFCERVWVAVRAKGIPYRERLISLQDKPDWYKELVPTTLVPAMLLHPTSSDDDKPPTNERTIIWESATILQALDDAFPSTPRLIQTTPAYLDATTQADELVTAGFRYVYSARNASLPASDIASRREIFLAALDALDASLSPTPGSFRLGKEFTAVDAVLIPTLERWRYQLPLTHDIDILDGRDNLRMWFGTMDAYEPYNGRVAGDEYSWTAVTGTFQRYFADVEDPAIQAVIKNADEKAAQLVGSFAVGWDGAGHDHRVEAARKLIGNHEAVVGDCTGGADGSPDVRSQKEVDRASDREAADQVLRFVAGVLLEVEGSGMEGLDVEVKGGSKMAEAAKVVARRVSVPRDMGKGAGSALRGVLMGVADGLLA